MGGSLPEGTETFDYVVIGSGRAGLASAKRAAELGKNVCLIENGERDEGAIDQEVVKMMFNLANFTQEAQVMKDYGLSGLDHIKFNFERFKAKRDAHVKKQKDARREI